MIPSLRADFNSRFTPEKYETLLKTLEQRCGTPVKFRVSETPCFFPFDLLADMSHAGDELIRQLVDSRDYHARSEASIPPEFKVPREDSHPRFIQVDFGLVRDKDGNLKRKLGIKTVSITDIKKQGNNLFYERDGKRIPIVRIYNRAIVDELERKGIKLNFDFRDDLNVEWAGHPNWYFRISKYSIPCLKHELV